jgi:hypothetical protein
MIDREELFKLVEKILAGAYSSEEEADADIERLTDNVLDPAAMDYLFQKEYKNLSAAEIVEKIMAYQPIRLSQ